MTAKRRQLVTSSTYVSNYTVSYSMQVVLEDENPTDAMQEILSYISGEAFEEIKNITLAGLDAIDDDYLDGEATDQLREQGHFRFHPR